MGESQVDRVRSRFRVEGIVQGVGFRPFVFALAERLGLGGSVGNDTLGVVVEVEGDAAAVEGLRHALAEEAPPLAVVDRIVEERLEPTGQTVFEIAPSDAAGERRALISPDMATCDECLGELFDPADRRYRYPFINCTNCGPRFTIVRDVPYDRPATTMAGFRLCEPCRVEYDDPRDRRFHAQPVCCPDCGPSLAILDRAGIPLPGEPLAAAVELLGAGAIVAIKGLGGYHLAVLASSDQGVRALRERKVREDKPFAVMVPDLDQARRLCVVDDAEERLLRDVRRPIVLLQRRPPDHLAGGIALGNRALGLMLPYTPVHHLLASDLAAPFVLTSGNVSDEPIAYTDDDALGRLGGIADAFLTHDRAIHIRTDDSVTRSVGGRETILRRSRGYVPRPVTLARALPHHTLACGAELKNTFCLAKERLAFVSHHIGDLENYETYRSFTQGVEHFQRLFDVRPEVVAHDLHPEYLSTKYAMDLEGVRLVGVQHHHAHVASCLADNGVEGPAIGVAFDGLGWGTDGTIWGGEFLVADLAGSERVGHLETVPMPGGAAAIRHGWRMAAAYLLAAGDIEPPTLDVVARNEQRWDDVVALARSGVGSPLTSSAGRLFDAVAALLGVRDSINYEGQAAIELEQLADGAERAAYEPGVDDGDPMVLRGTDLVRAVVEDLHARVPAPTVAARFHNGVAAGIVRVSEAIRASTGLGTVALSGGVFQNLLLVGRTLDGLERAGFDVLTHHRVPPNDGGISLGQVAVAGALR